MLPYVDWEPFSGNDKYQEFVEQWRVRTFIATLLRTAFGFPLAQMYMQQVGLTSEGLDVTEDPLIAFFFATHEYDNGEYRPRSPASREPAVIYRWTLPQRDWTSDELNKYGFDNCPAVIPSWKIIRLFGEARTANEAMDSILEYRRAINWSALTFDLQSIRNQRPLNIIKFPPSFIANSRIDRQRAALILPDFVEPSDFFRFYDTNHEQVRQEIESGRFFEDMSSGKFVEAFYFDPNSAQKLDQLTSMSTESIFPRNDYLKTLLTGWPKTFLGNPFGAVPLPFGLQNAPTNWVKALEILLQDSEAKLFI